MVYECFGCCSSGNVPLPMTAERQLDCVWFQIPCANQTWQFPSKKPSFWPGFPSLVWWHQSGMTPQGRCWNIRWGKYWCVVSDKQCGSTAKEIARTSTHCWSYGFFPPEKTPKSLFDGLFQHLGSHVSASYRQTCLMTCSNYHSFIIISYRLP